MSNSGSPSVLDRILDPISRCFNVESARALAALAPDPVAQARLADLAEKCNEGALSEAERSEYETYVTAGNFLSILKAKARLYLKSQGA